MWHGDGGGGGSCDEVSGCDSGGVTVVVEWWR